MVELFWEEGEFVGDLYDIELIKIAAGELEGIYMGDPHGGIYGGKTEHLKHPYQLWDIFNLEFHSWAIVDTNVPLIPRSGP